MSRLGNDYNYPSLNRRDLMYSRGLDNADFRLRKFKQIDTTRDWSLNNYSLDIKGAAPNRIGFYSQKPDFTLMTEDIEKCSPKKLYPKNNKPNYILSNRDIEKSIPRGHHCDFVTSRHVNPLEPDYPLPKPHPGFEPYSPKFIRDNIDISDIEGAKPRKYYLWSTKDNINIFEDENKKKKRVRQSYDYMDYRDVYRKENRGRGTNPLDPVYTMCYRGGVKYTYGPVDGSKPSSFYKYKNPEGGFSLRTKDIDGAQPDTKGIFNQFKIKYQRPLRYSAEDIVGAHAETKPYGIITSRNLNPLNPDYQYLGVKEEEEIKQLKNKRYATEVQSTKDIKEKQNISSVPEQGSPNRSVDVPANQSINTSIRDIKEESQVVSQQNSANQSPVQHKSFEIEKNNDISVGPGNRNDELPDFLAGKPYIKDEVEFDKEKYIRKGPNYGRKHDELLIASHSNPEKTKEYVDKRIENKYAESLKAISSGVPVQYPRSDFKITKDPYAYQLEKFMKHEALLD